MTDALDMDLVREFARNHSEAAFSELVRRHLNLVYSVARRCTGTDSDAQDVTQVVFVILARKAAGLNARTVLAGWLYETTRNTAARLQRTNVRRHVREQEAYMQSTLTDANTLDDWHRLAPHLEAAMSQLGEADRTLLALRFYENKSGLEAAALLGIHEAAAHKRTARALERLRKFFTRRGVELSAAAIAGAVSANSVQAAPAGLAAVITSAALSGTTITSTALVAATKAIAMTTLQKIIVTAALAVSVGVGIYQAKEAARDRAELRTLQEQQAPLVEQIRQLQNDLAMATNRLAGAALDLAKNNGNDRELLKLRGEVGVLQRQTEEANQKAMTAEQKLAEALSYKAKFTKEEGTAVNNMKMLSLAMRLYAGDNDGVFTNNLLLMTNELGNSFAAVLQASYEFDFVNAGAVKLNPKDGTIIGPDNSVQWREHIARQAPDGSWDRTYVFSDGRVIVANTIDGNFDAWERANTYLP
ncbi:MAG TPA: sigma-70 family RNA polymerase sigma factor [Candidatus Sulfotelmatobacter sp.]|jgi:RNA polymerase sigma factor (sigma-70 family)|nr:sigma-70 family RNA polymerase sigma factor [Candidatus Sulfotelmatobacter sp.]